MTRNADAYDHVSLIHTAVVQMERMHDAGNVPIGHGGYDSRAGVHRVYVDFKLKNEGVPSWSDDILRRIVAQIPEDAALTPGATIPIATRDLLALLMVVGK